MRGEELQFGHRLFEQHWDQWTDGILMFSTQLTYMEVKEKGAEMMGRSPSEIIGKTNRDAIGNQAAMIDPYVQEALEPKQPIS